MKHKLRAASVALLVTALAACGSDKNAASTASTTSPAATTTQPDTTPSSSSAATTTAAAATPGAKAGDKLASHLATPDTITVSEALSARPKTGVKVTFINAEVGPAPSFAGHRSSGLDVL